MKCIKALRMVIDQGFRVRSCKDGALEPFPFS